MWLDKFHLFIIFTQILRLHAEDHHDDYSHEEEKQKPPQKFLCPKVGIIADATDEDCKRYYQCARINATPVATRSCPPGEVFDTFERHCMPDKEANCFNCWSDGYMKDMVSPHYYIECKGGMAERHRCDPPEAVFNEDELACEDADEEAADHSNPFAHHPTPNKFGFDAHSNFRDMFQKNKERAWGKSHPAVSAGLPELKVESVSQTGNARAVAASATGGGKGAPPVAHSQTSLGSPDKKSKDDIFKGLGPMGGEFSNVHAMATATGTGQGKAEPHDQGSGSGEVHEKNDDFTHKEDTIQLGKHRQGTKGPAKGSHGHSHDHDHGDGHSHEGSEERHDKDRHEDYHAVDDHHDDNHDDDHDHHEDKRQAVYHDNARNKRDSLYPDRKKALKLPENPEEVERIRRRIRRQMPGFYPGHNPYFRNNDPMGQSIHDQTNKILSQGFPPMPNMPNYGANFGPQAPPNFYNPHIQQPPHPHHHHIHHHHNHNQHNNHASSHSFAHSSASSSSYHNSHSFSNQHHQSYGNQQQQFGAYGMPQFGQFNYQQFAGAHQRGLGGGYEDLPQQQQQSTAQSQAQDRSQGAQERSQQAQERSQQAQERSQQAQERAQKAQERLQQAQERSQQAQERSQQAQERSQKAQERSQQAQERSQQTQERSQQAQEKYQQTQERSQQNSQAKKQDEAMEEHHDEDSGDDLHGRAKDPSSSKPLIGSDEDSGEIAYKYAGELEEKHQQRHHNQDKSKQSSKSRQEGKSRDQQAAQKGSQGKKQKTESKKSSSDHHEVSEEEYDLHVEWEKTPKKKKQNKSTKPPSQTTISTTTTTAKPKQSTGKPNVEHTTTTTTTKEPTKAQAPKEPQTEPPQPKEPPTEPPQPKEPPTEPPKPPKDTKTEPPQAPKGRVAQSPKEPQTEPPQSSKEPPTEPPKKHQTEPPPAHKEPPTEAPHHPKEAKTDPPHKTKHPHHLKSTTPHPPPQTEPPPPLPSTQAPPTPPPATKSPPPAQQQQEHEDSSGKSESHEDTPEPPPDMTPNNSTKPHAAHEQDDSSDKSESHEDTPEPPPSMTPAGAPPNPKKSQPQEQDDSKSESHEDMPEPPPGLRPDDHHDGHDNHPEDHHHDDHENHPEDHHHDDHDNHPEDNYHDVHGNHTEDHHDDHENHPEDHHHDEHGNHTEDHHDDHDNHPEDHTHHPDNGTTNRPEDHHDSTTYSSAEQNDSTGDITPRPKTTKKATTRPRARLTTRRPRKGAGPAKAGSGIGGGLLGHTTTRAPPRRTQQPPSQGETPKSSNGTNRGRSKKPPKSNTTNTASGTPGGRGVNPLNQSKPTQNRPTTTKAPKVPRTKLKHNNDSDEDIDRPQPPSENVNATLENNSEHGNHSGDHATEGPLDNDHHGSHEDGSNVDADGSPEPAKRKKGGHKGGKGVKRIGSKHRKNHTAEPPQSDEDIDRPQPPAENINATLKHGSEHQNHTEDHETDGQLDNDHHGSHEDGSNVDADGSPEPARRKKGGHKGGKGVKRIGSKHRKNHTTEPPQSDEDIDRPQPPSENINVTLEHGSEHHNDNDDHNEGHLDNDHQGSHEDGSNVDEKIGHPEATKHRRRHRKKGRGVKRKNHTDDDHNHTTESPLDNDHHGSHEDGSNVDADGSPEPAKRKKGGHKGGRGVKRVEIHEAANETDAEMTPPPESDDDPLGNDFKQIFKTKPAARPPSYKGVVRHSKKKKRKGSKNGSGSRGLRGKAPRKAWGRRRGKSDVVQELGGGGVQRVGENGTEAVGSVLEAKGGTQGAGEIGSEAVGSVQGVGESGREAKGAGEGGPEAGVGVLGGGASSSGAGDLSRQKRKAGESGGSSVRRQKAKKPRPIPGHTEDHHEGATNETSGALSDVVGRLAKGKTDSQRRTAPPPPPRRTTRRTTTTTRPPPTTEPTTTEAPDYPDDPDNPDGPDNPEDPDKPDEPDEPENPDDGAPKGKKKKKKKGRRKKKQRVTKVICTTTTPAPNSQEQSLGLGGEDPDYSEEHDEETNRKPKKSYGLNKGRGDRWAESKTVAGSPSDAISVSGGSAKDGNPNSRTSADSTAAVYRAKGSSSANPSSDQMDGGKKDDCPNPPCQENFASANSDVSTRKRSKHKPNRPARGIGMDDDDPIPTLTNGGDAFQPSSILWSGAHKLEKRNPIISTPAQSHAPSVEALVRNKKSAEESKPKKGKGKGSKGGKPNRPTRGLGMDDDDPIPTLTNGGDAFQPSSILWSGAHKLEKRNPIISTPAQSHAPSFEALVRTKKSTEESKPKKGKGKGSKGGKPKGEPICQICAVPEEDEAPKEAATEAPKTKKPKTKPPKQSDLHIHEVQHTLDSKSNKDHHWVLSDHGNDPFNIDIGSMHNDFHGSDLFHAFSNNHHDDPGIVHHEWSTGQEHPDSPHAHVPVSYEKNYGATNSTSFKSSMTVDHTHEGSFSTGTSETHDTETSFASEKKLGAEKKMHKKKSRKESKTAASTKGRDGVKQTLSDSQVDHHEHTNVSEYDHHTGDKKESAHEKKLEKLIQSQSDQGFDGVIKTTSNTSTNGSETLRSTYTAQGGTVIEENVDKQLKSLDMLNAEKDGTFEKKILTQQIAVTDTGTKVVNDSGFVQIISKSKSYTGDSQVSNITNGEDGQSLVMNNTLATDTESQRNKTGEHDEVAISHQKSKGSESNSAITTHNGNTKITDSSTVIAGDTTTKTNKTKKGEVLSTLQSQSSKKTDRHGEITKLKGNKTRSKFDTRTDDETEQKLIVVERLNDEKGRPQSEKITERKKTQGLTKQEETRKLTDLNTNKTQEQSESSGNRSSSNTGSQTFAVLSPEGKRMEIAARMPSKHERVQIPIETTPKPKAESEEESGEGGCPTCVPICATCATAANAKKQSSEEAKESEEAKKEKPPASAPQGGTKTVHVPVEPAKKHEESAEKDYEAEDKESQEEKKLEKAEEPKEEANSDENKERAASAHAAGGRGNRPPAAVSSSHSNGALSESGALASAGNGGAQASATARRYKDEEKPHKNDTEWVPEKLTVPDEHKKRAKEPKGEEKKAEAKESEEPEESKEEKDSEENKERGSAQPGMGRAARPAYTPAPATTPKPKEEEKPQKNGTDWKPKELVAPDAYNKRGIMKKLT